MKRYFRTAGTALAMIMAMAGAAFADHMTGHYEGIGEATGTNVDLEQHGQQVMATISGLDRGQLNGQQTGQDEAAGIMDLVGIGRVQFQSVLQDDILTITVFGPGGQQSYEFQRAGAVDSDAVNGTNTAGDGKTKTATDTAEDKPIYYYTVDGAREGPVTLAELHGLVDDGTIVAETLIWKKGDKDWVSAKDVPQLADELPPPPPVTAQYYVAIDGARQGPMDFDAVVALIDGKKADRDTLAWTSGQADWAPLSSFEEFSDALTVPPPLPEVTEEEPPPVPENQTPPPVPTPDEDTPPDLPPALDQGDAGDNGGALLPAFADMLAKQAAKEFPEATDEQIDALIACSTEALKDVSTEDQQMLADKQMQFNAPEVSAFSDANPDVMAALKACGDATRDSVAANEPSEESADAGADATANLPGTSIGLGDGRMLNVHGNGSISVKTTNGSQSVTIGGTKVEWANGALTINGKKQDIPDFKFNLSVTIADDGTVTVLTDQ